LGWQEQPPVSQWTALHAACFAGRANCAEVLIRVGCDITAKDSQGCTAIGYAEVIGHTAVLEMLMALAKKEKKNRKRREQRKRAQSRRSTAAGQPDRELDEEPAAGLHGAAERAQPEATAAQGSLFFLEEKHTVVPGQPQPLSEIACKFEPEPEANAELDLQSNHEPNPSVPETKDVVQADAEPRAETETEPHAKLEEEPLAGPMAEFGEAKVQRWLGTVDGLTAEQLQRVRAKLAEEEYDGEELVNETSPKTFRRLLRGTGAEEAVPLLLAARDRYIHDSGAGVQLSVSPCRTHSHSTDFRIITK
jgi:hypothetical protein